MTTLLLTNDDGLDAPGLHALADVMQQFGTVIVVAPHIELSGCSHRVTTDRPLRLQQVAPQRYRLDGTPADCVRIALAHLDLKVDYVVSGINPGGNLGADVYLSGTVAAVREAAHWRIPGIAISQYRRTREPIDWDQARRWSTEVVAGLLANPKHSPGFWNVNLPDPPPSAIAPSSVADSRPTPPIAHCAVDTNPLFVRFEGTDDGLVYRGRYQERARTEGRDVACCFSGAITVSRIDLL
ncbi:MAG: 5'/3'-nucleotidase SurE [Planctomycetaceae bacterium]|nr:5'/3'-nucleotidase SurE [Planctomycetaceae bacterium]